MNILALAAQGRPLAHAEAVLLVGNDQPQIGKPGGIRQQGVGANDQARFPLGNALPAEGFFLGGQGTGQQLYPDAQRRKQLPQRGKVLLRQNFRRGHQGTLAAVANGQECRCCGHHGLAAAHVSLDQPVHGNAQGHIPADVLNGPLLGTGQGKGQGGEKGRQVRIGIGRRPAGLPGPAQLGQPGGEHEKFLEDHPPLGHGRFLHGFRGVDGGIGPFGGKNVLCLQDLRGQDLLRRVADGQGLGHGLDQGRIGQSRRQGVQGQNAPGQHRGRLRGLEHRRSHAVAGIIPGNAAEKDVLFSHGQLIGGEFLVEEGQAQPR